jgi:hypothetical protein
LGERFCLGADVDDPAGEGLSAVRIPGKDGVISQHSEYSRLGVGIADGAGEGPGAVRIS